MDGKWDDSRDDELRQGLHWENVPEIIGGSSQLLGDPGFKMFHT